MTVACGSKPLWRLLIEDTFKWLGCPAAEYGGGMLIVGMFLYLSGVAITLNRSESWVLPAVWSTIFAGVFVSVVPAAVAVRIMSLVTIAVAVAVIYVWDSWRDNA